MASGAFRGFPPAAFEFYERLTADNSRTFWQAHKATYEEVVRAPMQALCADLADYGPFHLFRPYHDLRFARNRPPYKTHQGAYVESEGGAGYYVHLAADGLLVAAGYHHLAKDQLERYRAAVDDDASGKELEAITADLERRGYQLGAIDTLKSAPRGHRRDHPRIELLRRKGLTAGRQFPVAAWMGTARAVRRIRETWEGAGELCAWLDTHVGPSTAPPDELPF
jgi:uncharacterized protein (TIGR02453 family)